MHTNTPDNNSPAPQNQLFLPEEPFSPVIPWPEPVKGDELLDGMLALLTRFVVLPKWAPETLILWSVHTFGFHLRDICTYIAVESPEKECGKSTLVTVLSHLVHRPVISSNISSSASFHAVEELNPTLLIDEGDTNLRRNEEFRGILNAGYSKPNAFVWRVAYDTVKKPAAKAADGSNGNGGPAPAAKFKNPKSAGRLARFTCWCPKLIASIGRIHDVLASRCIVISMQRKTDAEQCERTRFLDAADLKRKCARFIQDNADAIAAAEPEIPAGLSNRAADIWEPLFVIADLAGSRWPELARQAAIALTANARERNPIGALLLDILVLFKLNKTDRFFSRDLVAALARSNDRPWAELRTGKAIDETWLAKQLRPYGIHPCTIRTGEQRCKGYYFEDFREVFKRYIPRGEFEALYQELGPAEGKQHGERASEEAMKNQNSNGRPEPAAPASGNETFNLQPAPCNAPPSASDDVAPIEVAPLETQHSTFKNSDAPSSINPSPEPEVCLQCSTPLNPVAPGQERTQSHCRGCGTPVAMVPAGTSVPEKCPKCGKPQRIHGYNAERIVNACPSCGATLPELKCGTSTPWIPRPQTAEEKAKG